MSEVSRRTLTTHLASMAALTACAPKHDPVLVNLVPGLEQSPGEKAIETAFDAAARMTAPVTLDGKGPFPFVVDTGANVSVVASELGAELALPRIGSALVHGIAGAQPAELTQARLSVGAVSSTIARMPMLPRARLGVEGLLGMDVLRHRRLVLDYRAGNFQVTSSRVERGRAATRVSRVAVGRDPVFEVPARFRFGQLVIVDAEMNGVKVLAFLDSGSQSTVGNSALKAAVARKSSAFAAQLIQARLLSATGQTIDAELAPAPPLRLGGLVIGNIAVAFADLHIFKLWELADRPAILLGVDVLRQFNSVEIDYGARQVRFRPPMQ